MAVELFGANAAASRKRCLKNREAAGRLVQSCGFVVDLGEVPSCVEFVEIGL